MCVCVSVSCVLSQWAARRVNRFLTTKLREYALRLRDMMANGVTAEDLTKAKAGMMGEVFKVRAETTAWQSATIHTSGGRS